MGRKRKSAPTTDPEVDAYVERLNDRHAEIVAAFRKLLKRILPDLDEGVHWGLPVFSGDAGKVFYLKSFPSHVQVGFWYGAELKDPDTHLRGTGDGRMRHVKLRRVEDVDTKPLRALLRAAARHVPEE